MVPPGEVLQDGVDQFIWAMLRRFDFILMFSSVQSLSHV